MIQHEAPVTISKPALDVFAYITNLGVAPEWLESCIGLAVVEPKPLEKGSRLHYRFTQGGRPGEMDGIVTAYVAGSRFDMQFSDSTFDVVVTNTIASEGGGSRVTHSITITPKRLIVKLMSGMIGAGNRKQVEANVARLKARLEVGAPR